MIDTEGEQDGHVRANCIANCPIQLSDQLKNKETGSMAYRHDIIRRDSVNSCHNSRVIMVITAVESIH